MPSLSEEGDDGHDSRDGQRGVPQDVQNTVNGHNPNNTDWGPGEARASVARAGSQQPAVSISQAAFSTLTAGRQTGPLAHDGPPNGSRKQILKRRLSGN